MIYNCKYISYYYKLGIDKIFIRDDNDMNSERISDMIDFRYKEFVEIYEAKKINIPNQSKTFTDCYKNIKVFLFG